jgi:hypothetical protein
VGLGFVAFTLTIAGVLQGLGLMDAKVPFAAVLDLIRPFLLGQVLAVAIIAVSALLGVFSFLTVFVNPAWAPESSETPEPIIGEREVTIA